VQQFRYVTDAEADQLRQEKESAREKRVGASGKETAPAPAVVPIPAAAPSSQLPIPPSR